MSIDIIFPYEHHLHCPGLPVALPEQATEVAYIYATYQKKLTNYKHGFLQDNIPLIAGKPTHSPCSCDVFEVCPTETNSNGKISYGMVHC